MRDPRGAKLAHVIVHHSTQLQPGDAVLIEAFDVPDAIVLDLVEATYVANAIPIVSLRHNEVIRAQLRGATPEFLDKTAAIELFAMKQVQAYVGLRGSWNISELSDVPGDRMSAYQEKVVKPVSFEYRVPHTRWVVLRWPSPSMAQQAGMSTAAFEDYYFEVCTLDYQRMSDAMDPLKALMDRTDRVRLKGPGTDLRFSIKGIPSVKCEGRRNLPDGECFTAPVRDSVEGVIQYNTPSLYLGTTYENIRFTFEGGRIVKADGAPQAALDQVLATDEGARSVGEFSLGFNPHITRPMKDTLFDEKIAGSLHFTPGQAYGIADNGNRSSVHWDLVLIQTPEYGGGEVWFDDVLIRKDGRFLLPELDGLNPERLRG